MKKLTVILSVIFCWGGYLFAQFPKVTIPGSEVRKINSRIVNQEYELQISLPAGYSNSDKEYPVVYLMDSQWDFPLVKALYGQYYYDGFIPELIIVGVTWGGDHPNADSLRVRDYTPTKANGRPQSGGADNFLLFMKTELFPFIEANYKTDPANRTLMGSSLGGLITLYALFTHTEMFNGYVATSPAIGWDKDIIYQYESSFFEKHSSAAARLYMTTGDVERSAPGFEKFAKFLADRNYHNLPLRSKVLENTGHSGTKNETYGRGLQYVFERPSLHLNTAILNKYVGSYISPEGNKIEIKKEKDQLCLYFGSSNKYTLYAASEDDLYSVSEFLKVHFFTLENGKIYGFQLDRYGSSQFIKKVN